MIRGYDHRVELRLAPGVRVMTPRSFLLVTLTAALAADPRRETVLLPLADGLTAPCKR